MAHLLTHLTDGIPTRRPFHPAKIALLISPRPRSRRLAFRPARGSVDLQSEGFDDRRPKRNIGCKRLPEFFRVRLESGFDTRVDQHLLVGRVGNRRARRLRNLFDDPNWGPGRCEHPNGLYTSEGRGQPGSVTISWAKTGL